MPEVPFRLLLRRLSQALVLSAFALAPPQVVSGNLASSLWFGAVPLSDPFAALQALLAHGSLAASGTVGALLVAGFFALVGGRAFCAWICPLNLVSDLAGALRRRLGIADWRWLRVDRRVRHVVAVAVLAGSALGGALLWEAVNPITWLQRSLAAGTPTALWLVAAVFAFDLLLLKRGWCGHLCPVGAFYGWLGRRRRLAVAVRQRSACNDCGRCFRVCAEPHVIAPALRRADNAPAAIGHPDCTLCGRCIDVCAPRVFVLTVR
jgi:ferredoxin-type protein NapH